MTFFKKTLSFDDVLLTPGYSEIESRTEIDISSMLGEYTFSLPVISSPMDTVTGLPMATSMGKVGGLGIIHRYNSIHDQCEMVSSCTSTSAAAIGVSGDFKERSSALVAAGARIICIDVAHGHHFLVERAIKTMKDSFGNSVEIIAGNVATFEGVRALASWGADAVRVGIGGGSICSTRIQTGHGIPTFQSVLDCRDIDFDVKIIADGGIKTSGDIVKALAAGADFVMLGSMLAGAAETPGQIFVDAENNRYKVYRGMASVEAQVEWRGQARSLEGVSTTIPFKGPVKNIIESLAQNIRSGLSYSGARTIKDLQSKAKFITQTSSGIIESGTHILASK